MNLPSRFFVWKKSFELGIASIDADHQGFLELMNNLHAAMDRGEGFERTHATLDALRAYATYHFIREEDLMGSAGYPGLNTHRVQHAWYLYYLEKLTGQAATDSLLACETMGFMRNWFLDHILGIDKRFSDWLDATNLIELVALDPEAELAIEGLRCAS
jgi:hemerythrin-like metal-binding protein